MFPVSKRYTELCSPVPEQTIGCQACFKTVQLRPIETLRSGALQPAEPLPCPARPPILIGQQHRSSYSDGGVCADKNAHHQRKRKAIQNLATENIQREHCKKREVPMSTTVLPQCLIDAAIHHVVQSLTAAQAQVFANTVEDDDSVVHRIADQGQNGRN